MCVFLADYSVHSVRFGLSHPTHPSKPPPGFYTGATEYTFTPDEMRRAYTRFTRTGKNKQLLLAFVEPSRHALMPLSLFVNEGVRNGGPRLVRWMERRDWPRVLSCVFPSPVMCTSRFHVPRHFGFPVELFYSASRISVLTECASTAISCVFKHANYKLRITKAMMVGPDITSFILGVFNSFFFSDWLLHLSLSVLPPLWHTRSHPRRERCCTPLHFMFRHRFYQSGFFRHRIKIAVMMAN